MKILIICYTIDLGYRLGVTPTSWQLFKALHETGNEVIVIPYLGDPVESPWWRTYPNPCSAESKVFFKLSNRNKLKSVGTGGALSNLSMMAIKHHIRPKWMNYLEYILDKENDVGSILFFNTPLNHLTGIPTKIKNNKKIPVLYYDGDLPTSLPQYSEAKAFKFSYYNDADLGEYDAFLSSSRGAVPLLEKIGARNVNAFYYAVDPDLYSPVEVENKDIDIFYYGHGHRTKEERITYMVTEPSRKLEDTYFLVGGKHPQIDLGNAKTHGVLPISQWRYYCCRSKINLNITKKIDAETFATSSARPFELASMGCCVVTDSYNGYEEWFEPGKEVFMVQNAKEAADTYQMLLSSEELRIEIGKEARKRVLNEHTMLHRAKQLERIIGKGTINECNNIKVLPGDIHPEINEMCAGASIIRV